MQRVWLCIPLCTLPSENKQNQQDEMKPSVLSFWASWYFAYSHLWSCVQWTSIRIRKILKSGESPGNAIIYSVILTVLVCLNMHHYSCHHKKKSIVSTPQSCSVRHFCSFDQFIFDQLISKLFLGRHFEWYRLFWSTWCVRRNTWIHLLWTVSIVYRYQEILKYWLQAAPTRSFFLFQKSRKFLSCPSVVITK